MGTLAALKSQFDEVKNMYLNLMGHVERADKCPGELAMHRAEDVAMLSLFGAPRPDEELSVATARMNKALEPMHDTEARKLLMRARPDAASNPYYRAALYPHLEFHRSLAVDPAIKLERIFARAPDWLLIFTAVDFDAKLLGFRLRKLKLDELPDNAVIARNDWPWIPRTQYQSRSPSVIPQIPWNQVVEDHCNRILRGGRARLRRIRRGAQSGTIVDASPDSL